MDTIRRIRFEYCVSFLFFTVRYESPEIALQPASSVFVASLPFNLITLLLGWWGVPWGLMITPVILFRNLTGGIAKFTSSDEAVPAAKPAAPAESPSL
jgi:hypothetical protein